MSGMIGRGVGGGISVASASRVGFIPVPPSVPPIVKGGFIGVGILGGVSLIGAVGGNAFRDAQLAKSGMRYNEKTGRAEPFVGGEVARSRTVSSGSGGGQGVGVSYRISIKWWRNSWQQDVYAVFGGTNGSGAPSRPAQITILSVGTIITGPVGNVTNEVDLGGGIWAVTVAGVTLQFFADSKGSAFSVDEIFRVDGQPDIAPPTIIVEPSKEGADTKKEQERRFSPPPPAINNFSSTTKTNNTTNNSTTNNTTNNSTTNNTTNNSTTNNTTNNSTTNNSTTNNSTTNNSTTNNSTTNFTTITPGQVETGKDEKKAPTILPPPSPKIVPPPIVIPPPVIPPPGGGGGGKKKEEEEKAPPVVPPPVTPPPPSNSDLLNSIALLGGQLGVIAANTSPVQIKKNVCDSLQSPTCTKGIEDRIKDPINAKLDAAQIARDSNAAAQSAALGTIAVEQQAQKGVLASVLAFTSRIYNNQFIHSSLSFMTNLAVIHNAAMLSRDVAETLGTVVDNSVNLSGQKLKDTNGNDINFTSWIGTNIRALIIQALGADKYVQLALSWQKANTIYHSAMAVVNTTQSMIDPLSSAMEYGLSNVSKIGNGLREDGVVSENNYPAMDETIRARRTNRFERLNDTLEGAENISSNLSNITSSAVSVKEDYKQLREDSKQLKDQAAAFNSADEQARTELKATLPTSITPIILAPAPAEDENL